MIIIIIISLCPLLVTVSKADDGRNDVIHFRSRSYHYMMYDQLLWEAIDRDVISITLSESDGAVKHPS